MVTNFIFILVIASLVIHYINRPKINFMEKVDAQFYISLDKDEFLKNLTKIDREVRDNGKNVKESISIYKERILDFNSNDKHFLKFCIKKIHDQYFGPYAKELKKMVWNISKIDNKYENGLPHTRENIIFFSNKTLNNTDWVYVSQTLLHEKIHIFQRNYVLETEEFIKNIGFTKMDKDFIKKIPKELRIRKRSNPDMNEYFYGLNTEMGLIIPIAIYKKNTKSLSDIEIIFLSKNGKVLPKNAAFYFESRFPNIYQIEHPYEIMAEMISKKFFKPERMKL